MVDLERMPQVNYPQWAFQATYSNQLYPREEFIRQGLPGVEAVSAARSPVIYHHQLDKIHGEVRFAEALSRGEQRVSQCVSALLQNREGVKYGDIQRRSLDMICGLLLGVVQPDRDSGPIKDNSERRLPSVRSIDLANILGEEQILKEARQRDDDRKERRGKPAENYLTVRTASDEEVEKISQTVKEAFEGPVLVVRESYTRSVPEHSEGLEFDVKGAYVIGRTKRTGSLLPKLYYFGETLQPHTHHYLQTKGEWRREDIAIEMLPDDLVLFPQPAHKHYRANNSQIATMLAILQLSAQDNPKNEEAE